MKIAVIGANGNLGTRVCRQALDRGHEVKAVIYSGDFQETRASVLHKSLFDMSAADLQDVDLVISAFGGGFKADPSINKQAFEKYAQLMKESGKRMIVIGGAGSLYTDSTHSVREYEMPGYSEVLGAISKNIRMGIDELKQLNSDLWTVVCPSKQFDAKGPFTKDYLIGEKEELIYNENKESYVTYEDLACAMLDIAQADTYRKQVITVATKKA